MITGNIVMWEVDLFQDSDFAGNFDSESTSGAILCIIGSRTFVPTNWLCESNFSASHFTQNRKLFSLVAGLRMVGILALHIWYVVIQVVHFAKNTHTSIWETVVAEKSGAHIPKPS